ncbi:MAG: dienelactone hydrolase family protein, partial [Candidatus Eremiobacteraeota bacterium]|nr:dienelactone hydrolase family protein [Candidatus Eremiobacteraeota bacterium]
GDVFDPGAQTRAELNRRVFVGTAAGAAALTGTIAAALAQADGFGKFHPPIVPENDPSLDARTVSLDRDVAIPAYTAVPKSATKATPGVVVVQHIWGVDAQIRDVVRRFAKEGFVAIAPALFARNNPPSGDTATDYTLFVPLAQKLDRAQVTGDLAAGADWIRKRAGVAPNAVPPKVGITGFCMGGGIALSQIVRNPAPYQALAIFYGYLNQEGSPNDPLTAAQAGYVAKITVPVEGNFGGRDDGIPPASVRLFESKLAVPHDIKVYDQAGHGFFDDQRSDYVASAASDAWARTIAFFHKYLAA